MELVKLDKMMADRMFRSLFFMPKIWQLIWFSCWINFKRSLH